MSYKDWPTELLLKFSEKNKEMKQEVITTNDGDISLKNVRKEIERRIKGNKNGLEQP